MAKLSAGGTGWTSEGKLMIQKSLERAHDEEIHEAEEFYPFEGRFSDEDFTVLDDPYFELHTNRGEY